jgi:hypothetical protein
MQNALDIIVQSNKSWKILTAVMWKGKESVDEQFKQAQIELHIPDSIEGISLQTYGDVITAIQRGDYFLWMSHLNFVFSAFEEFCFQQCGYKVDTWPNMCKFLSRRLKVSQRIRRNEYYELFLAKQSRNCFLHRFSDFSNDRVWVDAYLDWSKCSDVIIKEYSNQKLRGKPRFSSETVVAFEDVEIWTDLIERLVEEIN